MIQNDSALKVERSADDASRPIISTKRPKYWYSAEELLHLRHSLPLVKCPVKNINGKADIACIFRLPEEAFKASDEFVCHSKTLSKFVSRYKNNHIHEINAPESSTEDEKSHSNQIDANHDFFQLQNQWNLRRRESTEKTTEPYSAPCDITAQKSENFQKFYRAVMSPTHVRVTAGGRIVPNTKPAETLGQDCSNDRTRFGHGTLRPAPFSLQAAPWPHLQPVHPIYPMMMPNNCPPLQNHLQTDNPHVFPPPITPTDTHHPIYPSSNENLQISNPNGNISHRNQELLFPQPIKISHPSQFDQTKPFAINGQIVYPLRSDSQIPANPCPLPIEMIGSSNSIPQIQPSFFRQAPNTPPFRNITNSVTFPHVPQPNLNGHHHGPGVNFTLTPNFAPNPALPIPAADFLKHQLQILCSSRDTIENQIANNDSQFYESLLESQHNWIECQIDAVKNTLNAHYSQENNTENGNILGGRTQTSPIPQRNIEAENSFREQKIPSVFLPSSMEKYSELIHDTDNSPKKAQIQPLTKSRLSKSSAKAPPFHPRVQTIGDFGAESKKEQRKTSSGNLEPISPETKRRGARFSKDLSSSTDVQSYCGWSPSEPNSQHEPESIEPMSGKNPYNHTQNPSDIFSAPVFKNMGAPYLVGTFPSGSQHNTVFPDEILYSRPLTDEEKRARYLYFGRIPRSNHNGLPKFDGKDFYPPSPPKYSLRLNPAKFDHSVLLKKVPNKSSSETIFVEKEPSTCESQLPIRYRHSMRNLSSRHFSDRLNSSTENDFSKRDGSVRGEIVSRPQTSQGKNLLDELEAKKSNNISAGGGGSGPNALFLSQNDEKLAREEHQPDFSAAPLMPQSREKNSRGNKTKSESDEKACQRSCISPVDLGNSDSKNKDLGARIQLSPKHNHMASDLAQKTFSERVESFRSPDQQTLFLLNMLKKNTPFVPLVGSALSGAITSTNARGYLPQYRGSAIASLSPTKLATGISEYDVNYSSKRYLGGLNAQEFTPFTISRADIEHLPSESDRNSNLMMSSSKDIFVSGCAGLLTRKDISKMKDSQDDKS